MTAEELQRALVHCYNALGESLTVISDLLNQSGNPEDIVTRVEDAQAKYKALSQLMADISE